jgi:translation initiation factor 3 subunit C
VVKTGQDKKREYLN